MKKYIFYFRKAIALSFDYIKIKLALCNCRNKGIAPVFVYQMGKVGSSSIYKTIKKHIPCCFHAHVLNWEKGKKIPSHAWHAVFYGKLLRRQLINSGRKLKIIAMVRDPVARNMSAFFQNIDYVFDEKNAYLGRGSQELISDFFDKYDHTIPLDWFDREMKEVTGLDVYSKPFPSCGYDFFESDNIKLLLLKAEVSNDVKKDVVSRFLGLENFEIVDENVGSKKNYSAKYSEFLHNISIPAWYIERMCSSKFVVHFYGKDFISQKYGVK